MMWMMLILILVLILLQFENAEFVAAAVLPEIDQKYQRDEKDIDVNDMEDVDIDVNDM